MFWGLERVVLKKIFELFLSAHACKVSSGEEEEKKEEKIRQRSVMS